MWTSCPVSGIRSMPHKCVQISKFSPILRTDFMDTRLWSQIGPLLRTAPALGFMLCCHSFEILNTFWTGNPPTFPFCTGFYRLCIQSACPFCSSSSFSNLLGLQNQMFPWLAGLVCLSVARKVFWQSRCCPWLKSVFPTLTSASPFSCTALSPWFWLRHMQTGQGVALNKKAFPGESAHNF